MSKALILKLRADRDAARASADTILSKLEAGTELTDSEKTNLETLTGEATSLDARIRELTEMETARIEALNLDAKFDGLKVEKAQFQVTERPQDLGSRFTESDAFKHFVEAPAGNSSRLEIAQPLVGSSEFAVANATVTGSLVPKQRTKDVFQGVQQNSLLEVMGYEPVSGNSLEWIEWPYDPTGTVTAENATKTESVYTPALKTGSLEKIAHHTPFTREIMEDIPRFQSILNGALLRGVRRKAETQAAAALIAATLPANGDGTTQTEAIRLGMAEVEAEGFWPSVCVMNPFDAVKVDFEMLAATVDGASRRNAAWGLQIVTATSVTAGTAYVGDFVEAMTLFDRQNIAVYMTDSHAAEFVDNVLRVLAEARMKAVVVQPKALCEVTFTPPTP
jgi:HK97 family phage major capsid protein